MTPPDLELLIPLAPRPKGNGRRVFRGRIVHPSHVLPLERAIRANVLIQRSCAPPLTCPVRLDVTYVLAAKRRVDVDNLSKLLLDALKGALYVDDDQVREKTHRKAYAKEEGCKPCYRIKVWQEPSS